MLLRLYTHLGLFFETFHNEYTSIPLFVKLVLHATLSIRYIHSQTPRPDPAVALLSPLIHTRFST